ncbi:MAG: hypothetical protein AAF609_09550 [Cyanobacteria bacterium P01_C01_bin.120]
MASKEQIRQHLSISSNIKLNENVPNKREEEARKLRIMEHLQRSKGKDV